MPARRKSDKLMIVMHGRGDSMKPFQKFDEEMQIPEMNYLLLNAPRKFLDGFSWYGEPPYQREGVVRIRQKLMQLLEQLEKQGWKSKNIFLFGFSQGCLISADLALNYPKKLGGVVGISGYFHFFPRWKTALSKQAKRTPWIFTHGFKDDVLDIDDTRFGVNKLKEAGLDVEWVELNKRHTLEDDEYPIIRRWVKERLKSSGKSGLN
ncbi:MAG: alpha/beta fold hydrolase [Bdellovibrionota bacterium]